MDVGHVNKQVKVKPFGNIECRIFRNIDYLRTAQISRSAVINAVHYLNGLRNIISCTAVTKAGGITIVIRVRLLNIIRKRWPQKRIACIICELIQWRKERVQILVIGPVGTPSIVQAKSINAGRIRFVLQV